jgi:hypothetical protein
MCVCIACDEKNNLRLVARLVVDRRRRRRLFLLFINVSLIACSLARWMIDDNDDHSRSYVHLGSA